MRKLFKGGNYSRAEIIWGNTVFNIAMTLKSWWGLVVTNQTFGLVKLFGQTSAVLFGPNDRTFFLQNTEHFFLYYMQCWWHSFIYLFCLNEPHVYTWCYHWSSCSVLFGFGSGNRTLIDLFCSGRMVKHCFSRSLFTTAFLPLFTQDSHKKYRKFLYRKCTTGPNQPK